MRMFKLDPIEYRTSIGDGTEVIHVNLDYILLITEGASGMGWLHHVGRWQHLLHRKWRFSAAHASYSTKIIHCLRPRRLDSAEGKPTATREIPVTALLCVWIRPRETERRTLSDHPQYPSRDCRELTFLSLQRRIEKPRGSDQAVSV
jgi:hypothetical protein